ncbi:hypothetical protein CA54_13320 [Symmachiella macrocystis]|uniref:Knr4/Smi1-like domain-containing protein n=1 Tax=Symmachiella macrocystis TaxID=2527985 RepID=A0A5C6BK95_9PLAN|nr:hypothetical protein [Symmachiella macrocystis]TWU12508.1 hypothetical protein CA54_13320 [Symmachiella macrocystis]
MLPSDSPFTNQVDIKELPHAPDGSFAWLAGTPTHSEWAIGEERADELPTQLASVSASATDHGLQLPPEFVKFIDTAALHKHLRSTTGFYLDVAESVLRFSDGYLIRFLSDQQGCVFWYLFTNADGSDHCVVMSLEYFDADEMDYEIEDLKETDFRFEAVSFEAFLSRFWLENEISFAEFESTPPPDVDPRFLELYRQN